MESFEDKLASLRAELRYYESQIYTQINAIHGAGVLGGFSESGGSVGGAGDGDGAGAGRVLPIDLRNDPRKALPLLQSDVHALLQEAHKTANFYELHKSELQDCEYLIETITTIVSVTDLIVKTETAVNSFDLLKSTCLTQELRSKLLSLPSSNSEIGSGAVCAHLRREAQIVIFRLHARLRRLIMHSIVIEKGRIVVNKVLKGMLNDDETILAESVSLTDIWTAIATVDQQLTGEIIDSLISEIWALVMLPLWREKRVSAPRTSHSDGISVLEFDVGSTSMWTVGDGKQYLAIIQDGTYC
jgi:hypothetical protein